MSVQRTGDGSSTLYSERYGQTFHSHHGAVTESRHVFLQGSGIAQRLAAGQASRVLEVGFGTGLNGWLSADAAMSAGVPLELFSLEQSVLPADVVRSLEYGHLLQEPRLLQRYMQFRAGLPEVVPPGQYSVELGPGVSLRLQVGEATAQQLPVDWADAVYHDAFSPDANPELWTAEFLGRLRAALKPAGRLVTYSVKGEVRRRLQQLGFEVSKLPGPEGGKREMLVGSRTDTLL